MIIQFSSHSFTSKRDSPEANYTYRVTEKKNKNNKTHTNKTQYEQLSAISKKSAMYTFTVITIIISIFARTMASVK